MNFLTYLGHPFGEMLCILYTIFYIQYRMCYTAAKHVPILYSWSSYLYFSQCLEVKSNFVTNIFLYFRGQLTEWLRHWTSSHEIVGSGPAIRSLSLRYLQSQCKICAQNVPAAVVLIIVVVLFIMFYVYSPHYIHKQNVHSKYAQPIWSYNYSHSIHLYK